MKSSLAAPLSLASLTALLLALHATATPEAKLITSGEFVAIHPLCADIPHDSPNHVGR